MKQAEIAGKALPSRIRALTLHGGSEYLLPMLGPGVKDTGREQPALAAERARGVVRLGIRGDWRERMMEKLGLHHRGEPVRRALREGLLTAHMAA